MEEEALAQVMMVRSMRWGQIILLEMYVPLVAPGFLLAYPYLCHTAIRAKAQ